MYHNDKFTYIVNDVSNGSDTTLRRFFLKMYLYKYIYLFRPFEFSIILYGMENCIVIYTIKIIIFK